MTQSRCSICGKPQEATYKPFCSRRCADVDLARWFNGSYAIPGRPDESGDGDLRGDEDDAGAGHPGKRRI